MVAVLSSTIDTNLARQIALEHPDLVTFEELKPYGITLALDTTTLELKLEVSALARKTTTHFIAGRGKSLYDDAPESILGPEPFSAYLNARMGQDFSMSRSAFRSDFESAIQLHKFVLDSNASFTEKSQNPIVRQDVRVTRDFEDTMIRSQFGDVTYPVFGFQRYRPLGGISASSQFSIQPYRVTTPSSNHVIFLKSPSRVLVSVNGTRIQTLYLPAGRHDLRNFALANGITTVTLEITDDVGRTETLELPWVSESDMLSRFLHQFSYAFGFPYAPRGASRSYDTKRFTASATHRYGATDQLTVGAMAQADRDVMMGAFESVFATPLGSFSLVPAASKLRESLDGYATRLRYLYTDYKGPFHTQRNFIFATQYRSRYFSSLDENPDFLADVVDLDASFAQSIWKALSARLSVSYQINRKLSSETTNGYGVAVNLTKSWTNGLQLSLTASERQSSLGLKERGVFALASWAIENTNHYGSLSTDTVSKTTRADWRYTTPQSAGGYAAAAAAERSERYNKAEFALDAITNRGTFGASHLALKAQDTNVKNTTSLRAGIAIAMAGGRVAIGRPISDGFAIVAPNSQLRSQSIEVNSNSSRYYDAAIGALGPALVPTLQSYQIYELNLDPSSLDVGLDLGKENYAVRPTYHSGALIEVGLDSMVWATGRLVDRNAAPLSLLEAHAVCVDCDTPRTLSFFTNKKGRFRIEGLKAGKYRIEIDQGHGQSKIFSISQKDKGIVDLLNLEISETQGDTP